jgi:hypothetical protein
VLFKAGSKRAEMSYIERNRLPLPDYTECIIIVKHQRIMTDKRKDWVLIGEEWNDS